MNPITPEFLRSTSSFFSAAFAGVVSPALEGFAFLAAGFAIFLSFFPPFPPALSTAFLQGTD